MSAGAPANAKPQYAAVKSPPKRLSAVALARMGAFNSCIRQLVSALVLLYPTDATIDRIKQRITLALDIDPLFVIRLAGPQLLKFDKQIYAKDVSFFLSNSYDDEIKESVNKERLDAAYYLIPRVKEAALTLSEDGKKKYIELIIDMLDNYVEFQADQMGIS
jgi:hypothetical protein